MRGEVGGPATTRHPLPDDHAEADWLNSSNTARRLGITPRHFRRTLRDQLQALGVPQLQLGHARHWHYPSVVQALLVRE